MLRKICIVLVLFSVLLVANCGPQAYPYKNSAKTGDFFYVSIDPKSGGFLIDGSTITLPLTDVTFVNTPVKDVAHSSDIFMTDFDLEFTAPKDCPVAQCPHLAKIEGISIFQEVLAGGESTVTGVPMAFPSTLDQFLNNTVATEMVIYKVKATYHGENEFGYPVTTSSQFALMLVP